MGFELAKPSPNKRREVNIDAFATQTEEIQKILQDNILIAQARYEPQANRHCSLAAKYKIRDLVWLNTRNLFNKRPSRKLENCHAGKYQVKKIISNHDVELDLFSDLHIYTVFYINFLESAATDDPYPSHIESSDSLIEVDGKTEYKVTAIINSCFFERTKKL